MTFIYWGKQKLSFAKFNCFQRQVVSSLILLFLAILVSAQSPAYFCYTKQQGLTCEEIYDVHQDKLGFIWVAGDRGVFRFDGYTFQPFTTAQGLTDNTVFRLHEDVRGRIWLMPFNGELCYIENNKVTSYQYNDTIEKYLPGVRIVRTMDVDSSGALEIGFLSYGDVRISASGKLERTTTKNSIDRLFWAKMSRSGKFLIGSSTAYKKGGAVLVQFTNDKTITLDSLAGIPPHYDLSGLKRSDGSILFCVGRKVYEIDVSGRTTKTELPINILSVMEDQAGCIWMGTNGAGIYKYAPGARIAGASYERFYESEIITSIQQDAEGSFWVATHHHGLFFVPNVAIRAWSFFDNDEAREFLPDTSGGMYVLWRDHGLVSIFNDTATIYPPIPDVIAYNALVWTEKHDALMIGTTQGAYEYVASTGNHRIIFRASTNSIICKDDKTYVGQSWNLFNVDADGTVFIFGDHKVRHRPDVLFEDCSGAIWVGALDGLYKVVDTSMIYVGASSDLLTRRIAGICELADSTLVVATQSNGIVFMSNSEVRTLSQADGFPCDHIYGIVTGAGNTVWCSTQDGVFEISCTSTGITFKEQLVIRSILTQGGKPGYLPAQDQLWLCDGNQVITFNTSLSTNSVAPRVHITGVALGDSALQTDRKSELRHDQNSLRISFCGIAYRMRGNVQYRYRLAGTGEDWIYTKQNTVEFAALAAGDYMFEVLAQNESGEWSSQPAIFAFTIVPPFWNTWWFIAGCIVVGGLLMYMVIVMRIRMIRRRHLLREQVLIFRQQALASQMNPHFVFNTLNTIQALVLKEEKTKALDMFSTFATLLRKSLHNSTERYIPLEEELRILAMYFELEEVRFEGSLSYQFILGKDVEVEKLSVPAMLIQPLVENALVHGLRRKEGGGEVVIRLSLQGIRLICEVEDNGIGRAASSQNKKGHTSAGTDITRDRLRVLGQMYNENYTFEIIDKINPSTKEASGTLVRLTLPYTTNKPATYEKAESINR